LDRELSHSVQPHAAREDRLSVLLASLRCDLGGEEMVTVVTNDEFWVETGSQLLIDLEVTRLATLVLIHGAGDSAWYCIFWNPRSAIAHKVVAMGCGGGPDASRGADRRDPRRGLDQAR
jgi:hypothetical protein